VLIICGELSAAQTEAFNQLLLHDGDTRDGLRPSAITDPH
jgi:hypothetical protein